MRLPTAWALASSPQVECIPLAGLETIVIDDEMLSIDYSLCCLEVRRERPLIAALFWRSSG